MKISACILTHNSENHLEKLLDSLDFVDEIVIVDDESTDNTINIAKKYNARVFSHKLNGFGAQRNFANEKAANDWILALDDDEVITRSLRDEICKIASSVKRQVSDIQFDGFYLSRLTYFAGMPVRHGGWFPDKTIRLFDKTKMKFSDTKVHEKVIPVGNIGELKNPLQHYSYSDVRDYLVRLKKYTSMQPENFNVPKNHLNLLLMFLKPIYRFFKMYLFQLGFLDGWRGLFLAVMSAYYDFRVHFIAEKRANVKLVPILLTVIVGIIIITQGYLINKFGLLSLVPLIGITILILTFCNLNTAIIMVLISILCGQLIRIYLPTGGGILLSDLIVPSFILSWIVYKFLKDPIFKKSPIDLSLALVIVAFIITFLINIYRYFDFIAFSYLARLICYLSLFWPLYDLFRNKNRLQFAQKAIVYLFYALIGLGILQLIFVPYLFFLMPLGWDPHKNRMVATFLDPNFLAAFLNIGFAWALAKFYSSDKSFFKKIWPVLIIGMAIIFTFSRSGYLMFLIISSIFALFKDRKIFIIGLLAILAVTFAIPQVKTRIIGGYNVDASATLRFGSWRDGLKMIDNNFLSGVGYNNIEEAKLQARIISQKETASHSAAGVDSSVMVIWITAGIVGLLIYLYWFIGNLYFGVKAYFRKNDKNTRNFGLATAAIFLGLLVDSIFVNSLLYSHILILIAFILAIFYNYYEQDY